MIKVTAVLLSRIAYWLLLLLVVALALLQLFLYLIADSVSGVADDLLVQSSQFLSETFGQPVDIGYASVNMYLGLSGVHMEVDKPSIAIGENVLNAPKAQLIVGFSEGVTLHIDSADLQFAAQDEGSFSLAGATLPIGIVNETPTPLRENAPANLRKNAPAKIIATNTKISFVTAKGERYALTGVSLGGSYDAQSEQFLISFYTGYSTEIGARGHMKFKPRGGDAEGYLRLRDAEHYLDKMGLQVEAESSYIDIWASYDGSAVKATLHAEAKDVAMPLAFAAKSDGPSVSLRHPYQMTAATLDLHGELAQPLSLQDISTVQLDWHANASGVNVNLREPYLGAPLSLDAFSAQGTARYGEQSWDVTAPDIRVQGPIGVGQFSLTVSQAGTQQPVVNASGSAPLVDYATLANLLPLSIGERGIRFLRDDLQVAQMQASTLVVQGSDWDKFPWPGDDGGRFRLQADFFGATLDYADGYPKLADAVGALGLEGTALAVTVAGGNSGDAQVEIVRAGIDDMDAVESTLFVAADLRLPDGGLFRLLDSLPDTKDDAAKLLDDLRLSGAQGLDIDIVVPLDTDDPVIVNGGVQPIAENTLVYVPLELTLSELIGDFKFDQSGARGIGFAKMLDTGVRLSLAVKDGTPQVQVDGTFDLAAAMAKLGIGENLPFKGLSQVTAKANEQQISLSSSLEGTGIDLPAPLGKTSSRAMPLQVTISAQGTNLVYGDDLLRATISPEGKAAIAFNARRAPKPRATAGTSISGTLPNIDLDNMTQSDSGIDLPLAQPIEIDLDMPSALLLGMEHPLLDLQATLASTLTVATFDAQALSGNLRQDTSGALVVSLSHLYLPESEDDTSDLGSESTIYIEPGVLSPSLPALDLTIDELRLGDRVYFEINAQGEPQESTWQLLALQAKMPGTGNEITASGTTNIAGTPFTRLDISITSSNLETLVGNFSEGESIKEGTASLSGTLGWEGSLTSPHFLSMTGSLDLYAKDFILNRDSQGVKLLNLLSPFTLLNNLDNITEEGFRFEETSGKLAFGDGLLNFEEFEMKGQNIDISVTGNTNLITERNDMTSYVKIKKSDNVATTAIAAAAPLAGVFLLFSDKVLGLKFLGDVEVEYSITGTWNEPVIRAKASDDQQPNQEDNN